MTVLCISYELWHWLHCREKEDKMQKLKDIKMCTDKYRRLYLLKEAELAYCKLVLKCIYDMSTHLNRRL